MLREVWDESDITTIHKLLPREVYKDFMKEEPELVERAGKPFGGCANRLAKEIVSNILSNR